ncbi:MAG: hypothetical protein HPY57_13115 [Ignavibacteria bacterium]|nr:hypothetical protein [Ignavibacteria bacterium]
MPDIKINKFRGLLTDVNDSEASLEFSEYIDALILENRIEAKKYVLEELDSFDENILDLQEIVLDEDKYACQLKSNEFKNTYQYDPQRYLLIAHSNKIVIKNNNLTQEFPIEGNYRRAVNHEGKVYILTDKKFYVLKRIRRYKFPVLRRYENIELVEYYPEPTFLDGVQVSFLPKTTVTILDTEVTVSVDQLELVYYPYNNGLVKFNGKVHLFKNGEKINSLHFDLELVGVYIVNTPTLTVAKQTVRLEYPINNWNLKFKLQNGGELELNQVLINFVNIDKNYFNLTSVNDPVYGTIVRVGFKGDLVTMYNILKSIKDNPNLVHKANIHIETDYSKYPYSERLINSPYLEKEVYITYLLDDNTELLYKKYKTEIENNPFVIEVLIPIYNELLYKHIIAIRVYIKMDPDTQPEMVANFNIFDKDNIPQYLFITTFVDFYPNIDKLAKRRLIADKYSLSGIYLTQTLGVYDKEPIKHFDDITVIKDVPFVTKANKIYYPVIGNGVITKAFYNIIPQVEGNLLLNINNDLGVYYNNVLTVIHISNEDELLFFVEKDRISLIINDYKDYLEIPEGLLILSSKGLYLYNTQNIVDITEYMSELIKEKYGNLNVTFNPLKEEIILIENNVLYIYDPKAKTWRLNTLRDAVKNIVYTEQYGLTAVSSNKLYQLKLIPEVCKIRSKKINLNEPYVRFKVNSIVFDGKGKAKVYINNKEYKLDLENKRLDIPIRDRVFNKYIQYEIELEPDTVLNTVSINYEAFRYDI